MTKLGVFLFVLHGMFIVVHTRKFTYRINIRTFKKKNSKSNASYWLIIILHKHEKELFFKYFIMEEKNE